MISPMSARTTDIRASVAATAAEVDAGTADTRAALRELGARGLLGRPSSADPAASLGAPVALVREVAAGSLATAFSLWSQTMVLEYLRCCPTPASTALVPDLAAGALTGSTGLAPALADLAGGQPLPVRAERDGDGWRLTGAVPWASNLFDDAVLVTPARTADGGRLVAVVRLSAATVVPAGPLLALNGTGTGSVGLRDVRVAGGAVLSTDLAGFVSLCLPAMLLLQAALAVGLADAALPAAAGRLTGPNGTLRPDHELLTARHAEVARRLGARAADPLSAGRPELAQLRLDALHLAADAVRLDSTVASGSGFRADSPTSRRVREVAFLPVQAPTEGQLRRQAAAG
ncbi:acyl-CoA dehydrogenase family protein [Modestobacter marinus]|uniref:acyl-CoA dehydrogenase family protein n=1 Tax=Modestobacter marinus TaxID=477641 RepID=UPI001C964F49|nr:acyl-CoA dehydrogenase family protein [Modestobacter marinus]